MAAGFMGLTAVVLVYAALGAPELLEIYNQFFRADVIPNFTFTRLLASLPEEAEIVEEYTIGESYDKSSVTILKKKD